MPWLEKTPARLRMEFIVAYESDSVSTPSRSCAICSA